MLLSFEGFIESDNVGVPGPPENVELLHDFPFTGFLSQKLLVDGLQSDELGGQAVNGQIDFTKGALTHNFTNLVVLTLGLWCFVCLCKA